MLLNINSKIRVLKFGETNPESDKIRFRFNYVS